MWTEASSLLQVLISIQGEDLELKFQKLMIAYGFCVNVHRYKSKEAL